MPRHEIAESRIYVVDDVEANRALLEAILRGGGLDQVHLFGSGFELLEAVAGSEPDIILLDLRMPEMDGLEVLRRLERRRGDSTFLPVVVLTADGNAQSRREALASGANDYVTKPFDPTEVLLRVRNLLHARALHKRLHDRNEDLSEQVDVAREDLAGREREWADVARALADLEAKESPEETAREICIELKRISGMASVMIIAVDAGGRAIPLAMDGRYDIGVTVNRPIPDQLVDRWRDRVGREPWVGPWQPELVASLQRIPSDPTTAVAVIPLTVSRGDLGALIAMTSVPNGVDYLQTRLPVLTSFGALAGALLAPGILERQRRGAIRDEIRQILEDGAFHPVFQPITELRSGRTIGFEALTRFADGTRPDRRFADAAAVGLGIELEAATMSAALQASALLPDDRWLSLNVSPDFLLDDGRAAALLRRRGRRALVLEVTEHVAIDDYGRVRDAVAALGEGVGAAVDDAGAGYASFRHILELRPGFVKLDIGLVRSIDSDEVRQALVAGIVYFAERTGCRLIAEGVETDPERSRLQKLGVEFGQGYLLGRPVPIESIMDRTSGRPVAHAAQPARSSRP